ncbi:hypothetical protein KTR9_5042 (plasmid) [Gordonia sp. KTR9]|nr:hypothetical protein KTR9_5042 [Gordonia sp. KTR9]
MTVDWLREFARSRRRVPGREDARSAERARCNLVIARASRVDLTGPPPRSNTTNQIDFMLEPLLDDHQRSWALAHTLNTVWRPVLTSVGVGVRADEFFEASAVDPEVFLAIVTGARKGRTTWRRADLDRMASATGIPAATIAALNRHMSGRWAGIVNEGELDKLA